MAAAIGYPLLVLTSNSRELGEIAIPFYMFVSAVVGAYVGFASWEDVRMNQDRLRARPSKDWRNDLYDQDYRDSRWR